MPTGFHHRFDHHLGRVGGLAAILIAIIGGWWFLSEVTSQALEASRVSELVEREGKLVTQRADALDATLGQNLAQLHGIPAVIANEVTTIEAIGGAGASTRAGVPLNGQRASFWAEQPALASLSRHFEVIAAELGFDLVYVLNSAGECVASSNFSESDTLIGNNFGDRAYFKTAMAGQRGRQYASGRITNIPGLYFSAPVIKEGRTVGVVTVKINLSQVQRRLGNINAFLADANGVVILAHNPDMLMRSTDPVRLEALSDSARIAQYKRDHFVPIRIEPINDNQQEGMVRINGEETPYFLAVHPRPDEGITAYTYSRLEGISEIMADTRMLHLLIFFGGTAFLLLIIGSIYSIHRFREHFLLLKEKEQAAQQANNARGIFLANMSHEIRTPMNAVIGLAQLLMVTPLDAKQQDYLTKIKTSATVLMAIINNILDLSKIDAGKIAIESIDFDLNSLLNNVSNIASVRAAEKRLNLVFRVAPDVPTNLIGDPLHFGQVLINLVNNAIKFTERGEVVLAITANRRQDDKVFLVFSVRDTGIGISLKEQATLFQAFNQADPSTTRRFGGSGLGLAISKNLIEFMGGTLTVKSTPGQGSTFTCSITLGVSTETTIGDTENALPRRASFEGLATPRLRGAHVLLVEDNAINQEIASAFLAEIGISVDIAHTGREAVDLALAKGARYDAILMDIQMPEMDGLEATRRIISRFTGTRPPVIALSAHALGEQKRRCLEVGMDDHLSKPIERTELFSVLSRWIKPMSPMPVETITSREESLADAGLPHDLPPFDLQGALVRLGGKPALLRRIIVSFHQSFAGAMADLDRFLVENKLAELERLAHSLKSVAATLGAVKLTEAAALLETAMHTEDFATAPRLVGALKESMAFALDAASELATLAETARPMRKDDSLNGVALASQIAELKVLLACNNPRARKIFAAISEHTAGHGFDTQLNALQYALDRLDFCAAETALAAFSSDLSPTLGTL